MRRTTRSYLIAGAIVAVGVSAVLIGTAFHRPGIQIDDLLESYRDAAPYAELTPLYPLDGTLFPPESVPPTFRWSDSHAQSDRWLVTLEFADEGERLSALARTTAWRPSTEQWELIKRRSLEKTVAVTILGVNERAPEDILSAGHITISTSKDEVGDSIFYREVILPFRDAVVDPSRIRWRFGAISSVTQPPVVLGNLPVCGNCHSFSADGNVLGMEVDSGNDKGGYAIVPLEKETVLAKDRIISWSDFAREDNDPTFGLLCQVSPDGRYVVGTVKDQAVAIYTPDLMFSQLFFLIKGIMCVYDRGKRTFRALPGADDRGYVQTNATWSPDSKYLTFARNKAHDLDSFRRQKRALVSDREAEEFVEKIGTYQYDLYRIPFNDGEGGEAEPIEGASHNGMSNYFAKYSPDGKWIVFCKARSFMLLQPDSELYIVPAQGGEARRMRCNTSRMNSWHSWSSNGRWLVFSSKVNTPYTQLFLTHIDEQGNDTPPVLLEQFTSPDRAANIPEFVNRKPDALQVIREEYVDDLSLVRAGKAFVTGGDFKGAIEVLEKALEMNPQNVEAHAQLGLSLRMLGRLDDAILHYEEVLRLDPKDYAAHNDLGVMKLRQGNPEEAKEHFREALRLYPNYGLARRNLMELLMNERARPEEAQGPR